MYEQKFTLKEKIKYGILLSVVLVMFGLSGQVAFEEECRQDPNCELTD